MSYCTRCLAEVLPDDLAKFLRRDHLCKRCAKESDATYAQRTIASEKQSTVPE